MQLLNPKNDKNKIRSFCLSISRRNTDIPEVIDEYSEILNLTKADTICHIIREYPTLKNRKGLERCKQWDLVETYCLVFENITTNTPLLFT